VARAAADRNLHDIDASDIFILLTTGMAARGGRHFETGYAFARGKPIVILGPVEHAFQHLANSVVSDVPQITDDLMTGVQRL
jgi:nucleoside 2-deoxyribosyltransferase